MSNFNYMIDIVEFSFADSFRKGLSNIGKKGKSVINDVKGSMGGAKPTMPKPTATPKPKIASSYKRPSLDKPVGYQNLTNTTKVTPGGSDYYTTIKNGMNRKNTK